MLGEDHPDTLLSAGNLAGDLRELGEVQAARDLDQDTLDRRRRVLGETTPMVASAKPAGDLRELGEVQVARDLDQDTLDRRRRMLGEDHPDTLTSANNLACDLHYLGEVQVARDLDQDTLDRRRRVLGEDHPDTLMSANNLACDLHYLGGAGGPGSRSGHPGPPPPGAGRRPPRHPDVREQPGLQPARAGGGCRRPGI